MNKITTEKTTVEHVLNMALREHENVVYGKESLCRLVSFSTCVTYIADNDILAIVGYMEKWDGVLEVYVLPSDHVADHGLEFLFKVRKALSNLFKCLPIHRMESSAWANDATDAWMKALKFECEGTLKEYTSYKHTYRMWARFK